MHAMLQMHNPVRRHSVFLFVAATATVLGDREDEGAIADG